MAQSDWLNENSLRAFPFRVHPRIDGPDGEIALPTGAIVDFGAASWRGAPAAPAADGIRLTSLIRDGDAVTARFSDEIGSTLDFVSAPGAPRYVTVFAEATEDGVCGPVPILDGFAVFGDVSELLDLIPEGTWDVAQGEVELSCVLAALTPPALAVHLANAPRVLASPPPGCEPEDDEPDAESQDCVPSATCLTGALRFAPGFNVDVKVDERSRTIRFLPGVGAGAGEPCGEVPRSLDEEPPEGSVLLSGGPSCAETILSINGAIGPDVSIVSGPGVRVQPDPDDPHGLLIDIDFNDLVVGPGAS